MNDAVRAERELEDIRRRFRSCMQQMNDFIRRIKVEMPDYRGKPPHRPPDIAAIPKAKRALEIVAGHFDMSVSRMTSRDRQASVLTARQFAQYVIRQTTSLSYPEIAELTGLRDHTTIMHAIRKVDAMRKASPALDAKARAMISEAIGDEKQCPRCENGRHTGKCEGSSDDLALRADQELERVRAL